MILNGDVLGISYSVAKGDILYESGFQRIIYEIWLDLGSPG